ncbi:HAMP domain-containing sensor histidine kinase [Catellatospora sp. KI3]|uniref:sensor histidine kinase n=1 Tax=Catellatospora sp. KI3 TaxID=3041620 RepID=UPI0024825A37|nr:HAMP domain-containing sensor histidine kinase [Catellatospora sp. KI3]MDI1464131.1 HAMP domain-containing sensor histidine kinase [Catellatospora sp. KI3]
MRRPGLRARVTAGFAIGALCVSTAVALLSYQITERYLLAERESTARRAVLFDADLVHAGLSADPADPLGAIRPLDTGSNRRAFLRRAGEWYSTKVDAGNTTADIPVGLIALVAQDKAGVQRVRVGGVPAMVIAVPLDEGTALYEVDFMNELDRSLRVLALVLTMVAVGTTGGGALLGAYATRRVLRPLASVADAAREIAAGDHSTRLDPAAEPELERLTTSFNRMVDQLQARMERDRRFAADVSHELRSPLQTLAAAASVLSRRREQLDERSATAVHLLTEEVDRFQDLVTDLLELARGDQPVQRAPVDVGAMAVQLCRSRGLAEDVVAADPCSVWQVERRRLEQILANLLDNAHVHGGGAVAVVVRTAGSTHELLVDDSGPGVGPADREVIFDRFVRGRAAGARGDSEGTGLGLALAAQHVTAHGGTITVADRPGGGARFRVTIPLEAP